MSKNLLMLLILFLVIISNTMSYTQEYFYGVNIGPQIPIRNTNDYWKVGVSLGSHIYYSLNPNILVGGHLNYNQWNASDRRGFIHDASHLMPRRYNWKTKGSISILEFYPSIRISSNIEKKDVGIYYFQLGLGLYSVNVFNKDIIVESDQSIEYYDDLVQVKIEDIEKVKFENSNNAFDIGFNIGMGALLFKRIEIFPLFHMIFTKDKYTKYLTLNVGIFL